MLGRIIRSDFSFFYNTCIKVLAGILVMCANTFSLMAQHQIDNASKFRMIEITDPLQAKDNKYYLLQLADKAKQSDLLKNGVDIVRPIGNDLFIVRADQKKLYDHKKLFKHAWTVNPLWKLAPPLLTEQKTDHNYFIVKTTSALSVNKTLSAIGEIKIIEVRDNTFIVYTSLEKIFEQVITLDDVTYVGIESREVHEESRVLDLNLNPNTVNQIHHVFPNLNGKGMALSMKELQYNIEDVDLQGRHIPSSLSAASVSNHATDMATIAAGAGNSFITGRGVARAANLTSSDFTNLLPDPDENFASLQAWVQNHSYGTIIENFYGALAEAYDLNTNRIPQLLHVFSSGNKGADTPNNGTYNGISGFANLTGNFKMSKNTLTVAAVDTIKRTLSFSSKGPAYDGRIKPELVAYSMQGSSNAAALVSGVVVLLQQAFFEDESTLPASALLKALLINSATDAGSEGIDFSTGFGNVDAYRTLLNLRSKHYFSESVNNGETKNFNLTIPEGAINFKATLVWNDPAAVPNAAVALVNDLDMTIKNTMGGNWLPWVLDASTDVNKLTSKAERKKDHLNNVEQITIENIEPGNYTIAIEGFDVSKGPQEFYIAYQWDLQNEFEWMFPTGSDNMPYNGESGTYFYWHSTLANTTGQLEYSLDNGQTWQVIATDVDLKQGFYRWEDILEINAVALARMVTENNTFVTNGFTISIPPRVTVGFNCADSVMIQWRKMQGANEYEVYTFNDALFQKIITTTDTTFIFQKAEFPSRLYAVQPVLKDDIPSIRSSLFDYELLNRECYLLLFTDEVVPEEGIYLNALLGTLHGVERLLFEHEKSNGFEVVGIIQAGKSTSIRFLHENPHQGVNRYRVTVQFLNGEEITSDAIETYFLTKLPFLVFPNPVQASEPLRIFSKQFKINDVTLRLYKTDGTLSFTTKLETDRAFVSLDNLAPGLYIYSISSEEGIFKGKIVVK